MKTHFLRALALCRVLICLMAIAASGCKKPAPPVEPISIETAVAEINKAFAKATGKAKSISGEAAKAITAQNFSAAGQSLTALTSIPELSEEQRSVASRCLISVNEKLQEAAAQGSPEAIQQLQLHHFTK
jgi:hypothetical protein